MTTTDDAQPNVLLMHCHDLGRYLGCYGHDVDSPNLDALAADGVRFTDYFCAAPHCSPSRGSIMTGKHPQRHGLLGLTNVGDWELPRGETTLPMCLRDLGYETHLFGFQHEVRGDPTRLGYNAIHDGSNAALDVAERFEDAVDDLSGAEPFFASVGVFEPHRAHDTYRTDGAPADAFDRTDPDSVDVLPYLPDEPAVRGDIADLQDLIAATLDEAVGRVREALEGAGVAEETVVVFTTDHGLAMPRAKGTCYDPGIETALIAAGPGIPEDETRGELLSNVDLMPMLVDLVGGEAPDDVDGRSFAPLFSGDPYEERSAVFAGMTWHGAYVPMRAIRTDRYKYVRNYTRAERVYMPGDVFASAPGQAVAEEYNGTTRPREELYDLEADPNERENLLADPLFERGTDVQVPYEYEHDLEDLRERLDGWLEATDDPILEGEVPAPNYTR